MNAQACAHTLDQAHRLFAIDEPLAAFIAWLS